MLRRRSVGIVALSTLIVGALGFAGCSAEGIADEESISQDGAELRIDIDGEYPVRPGPRWTPTEMGELRLLMPVEGSLITSPGCRGIVPCLGFPQYTFQGQKGWKVLFSMTTQDFRPELRITTPAGRQYKNAPRTQVINNIGFRYWEAKIELTLPETGEYTVLSSSFVNLRFGRPVSHGSYTLSASAELFCGGIKGIQCPEYLFCELDGDYMDAGGTCSAGSCEQRSFHTCELDPRCELRAWGCNPPPINPETGNPYPCDPVLDCLPKAMPRGR